MDYIPTDYTLLKVIILGNSGVGKTSLINQFVDKSFNTVHTVTVTPDSLTKDITIDDSLVKIQLWDTPGLERYQPSAPVFYHDAYCCVLVYDVSASESFEALDNWRDDFLIHTNQDPGSFPFVVLGNKIDVEENKRLITQERAMTWCQSKGNIYYFEISAKGVINVEEVFRIIAKSALYEGQEGRWSVDSTILSDVSGLHHPLENPNEQSRFGVNPLQNTGQSPQASLSPDSTRTHDNLPSFTVSPASDPSTPVDFDAPACKRLISRTLLPHEMISLIETIFASKDEVKMIRGLRGIDAQTFIDVIHEALDLPDLPLQLRTKCLSALCRICGRQVLLPRSLHIPLCYNRLDTPLYHGGFADVWKGEHQGLQVAVKVLRVYTTSDLGKIASRFCKEVVTWETLRHPNVLSLLGVMMGDEQFAMVSEWMVNGNINEFTKVHRNTNRFKLLGDVARGLIYLHDQAMIHGDLKGANILIDQDGHARLADFGLLTIGSDPTVFTASSSVAAGTTRWMSPELLHPDQFDFKDSQPTKESDCYALGMVVYEVLSGQAPFALLKDFIVMRKVIEGERPERPEGMKGAWFTDDLWGTVNLCWATQPKDRLSIKDVLERLEKVSRAWKPPSPQVGEDAGVDEGAETDESDWESPTEVTPPDQGVLRVQLLSCGGTDLQGESFIVFTLGRQMVHESQMERDRWNEVFSVTIPSRVAADFQLEVFDGNKIEQAKSLGTARIDLEEVEPFRDLEKTIPLSHDKYGGKGWVRVCLHFRPETTTGQASQQIGAYGTGVSKNVSVGPEDKDVFPEHPSNIRLHSPIPGTSSQPSPLKPPSRRTHANFESVQHPSALATAVQPPQRGRVAQLTPPPRSPPHNPLGYPPDNWISVADEKPYIAMPPPHHMSPSPSPVAIEPPTRIPNPAPVPPPPVVTEEATVETSAMSGSSSESTSTSTGDTPEPPDKLNGEVNDPDVTSPGPLAEEPVVPTPEEVKEQGNEMFKSKNYTGAIDLYTQAIDLSSGNEPSYLTNRAAAYMALKRFKLALADCQQAASLQMDCPSTKTLIRLARCQMALGSSAAALSTIYAVLDLEPANSVALQLQTKVSQLENHQANYLAAMKRKEWALAGSALDRCLQGIWGEGGEIPVKWRLWRTELELARGDWDRANTSAIDALRFAPNSPDVLATRGLVLFLFGRLPQALQHVQSALRLDPGHEAAMQLRKRVKEVERLKEEGNKSFKSGILNDAIEKYTAAVERIGNKDEEAKGGQIRATLLSNRATTLVKLNKHDEALTDIEESIILYPGNFKALRTRARIHLHLENFEGSVADFKAALKLAEFEDSIAESRYLRAELRKAEAALKRSKTKDYYKVLGVARDCTKADIKKAYHDERLIHHPDKGGDKEKYQLVVEAFTVLSDPHRDMTWVRRIQSTEAEAGV